MRPKPSAAQKIARMGEYTKRDCHGCGKRFRPLASSVYHCLDECAVRCLRKRGVLAQLRSDNAR